MSPQILVVDDEPGMLETLNDILVAAGYEVTVAGNGTRALELLRGGGFDAVLMDIRMPDMDGVQVFVESGAPPPPVILMTAYAMEERLRTARDAQVHAVLHKPFAAPHLLDVVAEAIAA